MSIVDSLKKLAVKLGRAKTPEEIYAPDITTALKQVAVGYGVADDPSKVPGSSIDDVIDVLTNKIEPGGGGNPNRVQLVTGTYENLFNGVGLETLATALNNQQATVIILTASMLFASVYMDEESGKFAILATDFVYAPATDDFSIPPSQFIWGNGYEGFDEFVVYTWDSSTKKMKDVTQQYGQSQAVAVIIWHPLPDGSWPPF